MKISHRWWAVALALTAGLQGAAWSMPYREYLERRALIRLEEDFAIQGGGGGRTRDEIRRASDIQVLIFFDEFVVEEILAGRASIGAPLLNGEYAVGHVANGVDALLQFQFLDTSTRLLTGLAGLLSVGVSRVDYSVNLDPSRVDADGIALYDVVIGSSTDIGSFFAMNYVPTGFEDDIFAIPYDANGNPIVFEGLGGNVATGAIVNIFSVPEPSTVALLIGGLYAFSRRKARSRRSG